MEGGLKEIRVDSGACNNFLMQFQANLLDVDVVRPKVIESTAFSTVFLAGLAVGYYENKEAIKNKINVDRTFTQSVSEDKKKTLLARWDDAVKRLFGIAK